MIRTATVTQLLSNFALACRALTPFLQVAFVPWRDEDQYDNWDRIAEPLFHSLVAEPCAFAAVGEAKLKELRMAGYGFKHSAECNAWIAPAGNLLQRFRSLSSVDAAFDHVVFDGPAETVPLQGLDLVFVFQTGDALQHLKIIDLGSE